MNFWLFLLLMLLIVGVVWRRRKFGHVTNRAVRPNVNLLRAVGGDRKLAQRLLDQARWKYPGKSDRWYVEKVIYDLDRDRGRY